MKTGMYSRSTCTWMPVLYPTCGVRCQEFATGLGQNQYYRLVALSHGSFWWFGHVVPRIAKAKVAATATAVNTSKLVIELSDPLIVERSIKNPVTGNMMQRLS